MNFFELFLSILLILTPQTIQIKYNELELNNEKCHASSVPGVKNLSCKKGLSQIDLAAAFLQNGGVDIGLPIVDSVGSGYTNYKLVNAFLHTNFKEDDAMIKME